MYNYKIKNEKELNEFMCAAKTMGCNLFPIKGMPPPDAKYSDGSMCIRPVNIAWVNETTGERIDIYYERK